MLLYALEVVTSLNECDQDLNDKFSWHSFTSKQEELFEWFSLRGVWNYVGVFLVTTMVEQGEEEPKISIPGKEPKMLSVLQEKGTVTVLAQMPTMSSWRRAVP